MIRVLLIDHYAIVREGVRLMLGKDLGIEVVAEAKDEHEALQQIRHNVIDVVVSEIAFPSEDGLALLEHIRHAHPNVPVLVLTLRPEEAYALRAIKLGAKGYLTKNTRADELAKAVHKLASGGSYVNPSLLDVLAAELGDHRITVDGTQALTHRELDILRRLVTGEKLVEIARALFISPKTVTSYRARIVEKLGVLNSAELVRYALANGLVA